VSICKDDYILYFNISNIMQESRVLLSHCKEIQAWFFKEYTNCSLPSPSESKLRIVLIYYFVLSKKRKYICPYS
jgi:hypothetical protein